MKKMVRILSLVLIILSLIAVVAYADGENNFPGGSNTDRVAGQIQKTVYEKLSGPAITFGGLAAFIGVVMCGFEMIFSKFNPEKRGSAMSSIVWVGGGLLVIGLAGLIAGFLMNIANSV